MTRAELHIVDAGNDRRRCAREGCANTVVDAAVGPRRKFCTDQCRSLNARRIRSERRRVARARAGLDAQAVDLGLPESVDSKTAQEMANRLPSAIASLVQSAEHLSALTRTLRDETQDWAAHPRLSTKRLATTPDRIFVEALRVRAQGNSALRDARARPNPSAFGAIQSALDSGYNLAAELCESLGVDVNLDGRLPIVHDLHDDLDWIDD